MKQTCRTCPSKDWKETFRPNEAQSGKTASFHEIASAEGLAERHIRRLVPLAFLSPKIIQTIADGTLPRSDGLKPDASPAPRLDRTRANARPRLRQTST